ncbi:MAG: GNAT family N-acetyltransferase [Candidatus Bathyarchaeia archaeon]
MAYKIIDITHDEDYEKYLYKCLAPAPYRQYSSRRKYLEKAIPEGFRKKLLIFNGEIVGQIEYGLPKASGYPIIGENLIVMNCVWVLRKAKGHGFGRLLVEDMIKSAASADAFATIGLENHWSPWFRKWQMEKLGFKPLDKIDVTHKLKHPTQVFSIHLMWVPIKEEAVPPSWDKQRILEGQTFCLWHPLYRPQTHAGNIFEAKE